MTMPSPSKRGLCRPGAKGFSFDLHAEGVPPTPNGHILFVLHTHLPWVLGHGRWPHGEAWLYEATAECYLPILRLLDRLEEEGRKGAINIGITPVLAEMLASSRFREGFVAYADERIRRAAADRQAFEAEGDQRAGAAKAWSDFYERAKADFLDVYKGDLLSAFARLQDSGRIEIIGSAATHGYLPLLGRDESIQAQLAIGVASYRRRFGRRPRGIWLPECAYRPGYAWSRPVGPERAWVRPGLEEFLVRQDLRYFFVDTHLVSGGAPIGTYDERIAERRLDAAREGTGLSPNEPYALSTAGRRRVAVLARDPRSSVQVWSADYGYPGDGAYLEFHRKHGMDGLRYWRVTDRRLPLKEKVLYDPQAAKERVEAHAEHFASLVMETLQEHHEATGRGGVVVAPFDTELFGHWWFEGTQWLEAVLRKLEGHVEVTTASDFLAAHPPRSAIRLPEGSWGQGGHHWVWLNDNTRWIWDAVYRAEDAFMDASRAFRTNANPTVRRVLMQLSRELLLLESSDWPFLVTTVAAKDYAEARVKGHVDAFDRLRSMLNRARDGTLSPDDASWLAEIEARDAPFPDASPEAWTLPT
jgi:1,4-alpha-glucan branching enzyme